MSQKIARNPLDFPTDQSVRGLPTKQRADMDTKSIAPVVKACFAEMQVKLKQARQIAKAAEACAEAGSLEEAVQLSMGIEQLIYDADRLHDAVMLLGRMITADR
ncbi:hypothetical protein [Bradyrhizobium sp. AT1]|uniref:hypothetical protein n=1 Tax=Bradyrhizobium sp. AT1 TaxID=574934 RepID=UPI001FD89834|nr:hypothetical protein [Bradyrhizobium sp. AT1]